MWVLKLFGLNADFGFTTALFDGEGGAGGGAGDGGEGGDGGQGGDGGGAGGEGEGGGDNGEGAPGSKAGKGAAAAGGAGGGQGGEGEGGDGGDGGGGAGAGADAEDIFGGDYGKALKSFKELSKIHKPTEMELAGIKKQLAQAGIKVIRNSDGSIRFEEDKSKAGQEKQRRFTEEHATKLHSFFDKPESGKGFQELITNLILDTLDDQFATREAQYHAAVQFRNEERQTEAFIAKVYPDADPDREGFPEGGTPLYKRATEIFLANPEYQKHPKGQLWAVHEAALELKISPKAISEAEARGKKAGFENKRILNKVGGGGGAGGGGGTGLSNLDFIKMNPTQRAAWQKEQFAKRMGGSK